MFNPKVGASWESYAMEQILRRRERSEAYFWVTQSGAKLDLLVFENGKRVGYEFKFSEKLKISRSMRIALEDLQLDCLRIVCPGDVSVQVDERIEVVGLESL